MGKALLFLFTLVTLVWIGREHAMAEKRVALVIGNSNYESVPNLKNPKYDAKLMAKTLLELHFELVGEDAQIDVEKEKIDTLISGFRRELENADVGLFYFAGHGVQVQGTNYLLPVDANPVRDADASSQLLDANWIIQQMQGAKAKLSVLILDACRTNPLAGRAINSSQGGLGEMPGSVNTLIAFATAPGRTATDGDGENSPYTLALAHAMKKPGLGIFDVFNDAGKEVVRVTSGTQEPRVSTSSIQTSFYFVPPANQKLWETVQWTPFPKGTHFANIRDVPVQIYLRPDRTQPAGLIDVRTRFPPSGEDQPLMFGSYEGETWLRFQLGSSKVSGYVPQDMVQILQPGE